MKIASILKILNLDLMVYKVRVNKFHTSPARLCSVNLAPNCNVSQTSDHFLKNKFNEFVSWYEQLTGMDEVRAIQNRVIEAQDKFVVAQEKRREATKALAQVQTKLKDIYSELDTTSRGEERYLQLITQEHSILKEERKLQAEFSLGEREERDCFTLLSNCVKESHEKERAQAERTKYWSVIGSVVGTIIGILGSSINNEFKMKELRRLVKENTKNSTGENAALLLSEHEKELSSLLSDMKSMVHNYKDVEVGRSVLGRLDQLLHTVSQKNSSDVTLSVAESVEKLDQNLNALKVMLNTAQRYDGQLVVIPTELESLIEAQKAETRLLLIGVSVVSILVPVIISFLQR